MIWPGRQDWTEIGSGGCRYKGLESSCVYFGQFVEDTFSSSTFPFGVYFFFLALFLDSRDSLLTPLYRLGTLD